MMAILTGVRWCLILVLNCLSVVIEMLGFFLTKWLRTKPSGPMETVPVESWFSRNGSDAPASRQQDSLPLQAFMNGNQVCMSPWLCVCGGGGAVSMEAGQEDGIVSKCSLSDKCSRSYQGNRMGKSLSCHTLCPSEQGWLHFRVWYYFIF